MTENNRPYQEQGSHFRREDHEQQSVGNRHVSRASLA